MTPEELEAFIASAKAKRDEWTARRREYVAALSEILPGMRPWPIKPVGRYRIRPDPGTIDAEAVE